MTLSHKKWGLSLFFLAFIFLLFNASPELQPYRDTGELATVCSTLSVAHPPGYPAYTVLGKFFNEAVLFGNPAYRTKIMSVFFSAAGLFLLFNIFLRLNINPFAAFLMCLVFLTSRVFWLLGIVCESYSPDLFFLILLLYIAYFFKDYPTKLYLFSFVFGVALGIRPTPVLAFPAFALIFVKKNGFRLRHYLNAVLFFVIGVSVFLYMPIRSKLNPPIDWADTETLSQFLYSVTRKAYGHGLDKISQFYTISDTFFRQIFIFSKNLFFQFTPVFFFLGLWGVVKGIGKNLLIQALFVLFVISGPFFIYLSKMPANPHALVIVEASYLVPFFCFFVFVVYGMRKVKTPILAVLALAAVLFNIYGNSKTLFRRNDFFSRSYAENVFASTPKNSLVLLRKDVQLFSVWYQNIVNRREKDYLFLAQGMLQAPWYQKQILKTGRVLIPEGVYRDEFFKAFIKLNKRVLVTNHFEVGSDFFNGMKVKPFGILRAVNFQGLPEKEPQLFFANVPISILYTDFYHLEMCDDYSEQFDITGLEYYRHNRLNDAEKFFLKGLSFNPYNFNLLYDLGAVYQMKGDSGQAEVYYRTALIALNREYRDKRTAPFIDGQKSRNYNNLGTLFEKKGSLDKALSYYEKAVELNPTFAQGYYNMGVVYWRKKDWKNVIYNFKRCLEIDPMNQSARHYLKLLTKSNNRT
ncbi:MAG: DUF2723 domain-containing protein [Elusimicrobia bacterium]|nr:DUF2723 domain-containing protein [Elusimicrobiota bacterium]